MIRITGGSAKGRALKVPASGTRPTTSRIREAVFQQLSLELYWPDIHVLDLYCGAGTLGLEAASRGASAVTLVDKAPAATKLASQNIATLGFRQAVEVLTCSAQAALGRLGNKYHLVLADPPYDLPDQELLPVLEALPTRLHAQAIVVVERALRAPDLAWPQPFVEFASRVYGDTRVLQARLP